VEECAGAWRRCSARGPGLVRRRRSASVHATRDLRSDPSRARRGRGCAQESHAALSRVVCVVAWDAWLVG